METNNVHHIGLKNLIKLIDKDHLDLFIQIGTSLEYGNYKSPQNEFNICKPNSNYGIASKDSSKVFIKDTDISNTKYCLAAYRKKQEFSGSVVLTDRINCDNYFKVFEIDTHSRISKKNINF